MFSYYRIKKHKEAVSDANHLLKLVPDKYKVGKSTDDLKQILLFKVNEDNQMVFCIKDGEQIIEYPFII